MTLPEEKINGNLRELHGFCCRECGEFALVYANIDRFKLVNELYGDEEGDRVLRQVHKVIDNELLSWDEVSGRIMADNFGMLLRFHSMKKLEHRLNRLNEQLGHLCDEQGVSYGRRLFFGVYLVTDKEMSVSAMLERANLALKKTLQLPQQLKKIGVYDEKEHRKLEREKHLEMRMERALKMENLFRIFSRNTSLRMRQLPGQRHLCAGYPRKKE